MFHPIGEPPASSEWSARDYVLYGRYCEPETIAAGIERLRAATGSRAAILVVYLDRTIFHSLLLVAHEDEKTKAGLQKRLTGGTRYGLHGRSPFERFARGGLGEAEMLEELRGTPPFVHVSDLLSGDVRVVSRTIPVGRGIGLGLASVPIQALLVDPQRVEGTEDDLDELLVMVNASAAVAVHANIETERRVDAALDRVNHLVAVGDPQTDSVEEGEDEATASFLGALLKETLTLTSSDVGNIYFANPDGKRLSLVAAVRNARPRKALDVDDDRSIVSWVYRRRRPMVINDIAEFLDRNPQSGFINVAGTAEPYAELAMPIMQYGLGSGGVKVIGVVNVEKLGGGLGRFTYRDATILRSVAHRLSLWSAYATAHRASVAIAALTRRNAGVRDLDDDASPPDLDPRVPVDAEAARETIEATLRTVHDLTRSYSATLRLLSPDRRSLMRFAAHPPERMTDPDGGIWIGRRDSVVAWVAREGRPCSLWNVRDSLARRRYRGLEGCRDVGRETRSELCLPVFVSGRLVGVLNLESRFVAGFADAAGIGAAFAEQLGLAIQNARRSYEQAVLSMSTATTANVHELGKLADRLRELGQRILDPDAALAEDEDEAPEQRLPLPDRLAAIAAEVDTCSRSGVDLPELPPVTTSALVRQTLVDLAREDTFELRNPGIADAVHHGSDALALRVALTALFDNAYRRAANSNPGCYVAWRTTKVGGRDYLTLMVGNNIVVPPDEAVVKDLFRRPIRYGSDRTRLGAFTAGALVRALGGDVFVRHSTPPRFVVGIDLPLAPRAVDLEEAA